MKKHSSVLVLSAVVVAGVVAMSWLIGRTPMESAVGIPRIAEPRSSSRDGASAHLDTQKGDERNEESASSPQTEARTIVEESPTEKLSRMKRTMNDLAAAEEWDKRYSGLDKGELRAEQANLEQAIVEATSAYFEAEFSAGRGATIDDRTARTEDPNPFEIQWKRFESGKAPKRCVAPEARFPDAYKLRMLSVWLGQRAFETAGNVAKR